MSIRGAVTGVILASASVLIAAPLAAVARDADQSPGTAINDPGALIRTAEELLNSSKSFDEDAFVGAFRLGGYGKSRIGLLHLHGGPPGAFIRGASYIDRSDGRAMAELSLGQDRCLTPDFAAAITGVAAQDNYVAVWALRGTYSSYERIKQGARFEWKIPSGLAVIALVDPAPNGSCYRTLLLARHPPGSRDW